MHIHVFGYQVNAFVGPKPETVEAVNAWLKENDIEAQKASPAGDWFSFSIPVSKANALLDADFQTYSNADTGTTAVRTLAYSVPKSVKPFLDFIYPATA